jgi:Fe-S-cluster-containing hydrogenase component 2/CRP-like cAMP-binding protein
MEDLHADWETIRGHLQPIKGFDPKAMERYFEEGPAKKGVHFFLIQYAPGEVIMAKGTTSDYAALHVQGLVRVRDIVPAYRTSRRGCWDQPLARRLEDLVLAQANKLADAEPGQATALRGAWLGWTSRPLAVLYRSVPEIPLRILDCCERWLPAGAAERWRSHLARVLHGRIGPVWRAERELSDPKETAPGAGGGAVAEKALSVHNSQGQLRAAEDRFMGVAGTLWNQPRSVTLVADDDPADGGKPCVMLLIKRKALEEIIKKAPAFYENRMQDFVQTVLPDILARNRLFQDRLFAEDIADWSGLLAGLRGEHPGPAAAGLDRVRERLGQRLTRWLGRATAEHLDGPDKNQIVDGLNQVLSRRDLADRALWSGVALPAEAKEVLGRPPASLNEAEVFRLNRLLLEAAMPGVVQSRPRPFPLTRGAFVEFTTRLAAAHQQKFGKVLRPERLEVVRDKKTGSKQGVPLTRQGEVADAVVLVLSGMVRVSVDLPGGRTMVNNLGADTCLGESAILDGAGPGAEPPRRTASAETLCDTTVLRLGRDILKTLCEGEYRALGDKLRRERALLAARDELMRGGGLVPPTEPPLAIAKRLVLTRNLLVIDMARCTRCDQCVRGCAEAHDFQPRFHRANPELRFGMWEVAGACLHCLDAPCQQACPVGAITLLEDSAVQIHRDRCIGCSQCANECPFGVIDMYTPLSPEDAPSSKNGIVANKCDLCLTEDRDPPCVACCPYDAARRVAPVEFFPELRTWASLADRT